MASKFADFLKENKIDERRLMSSSALLERLRPEDRAARLAGKKRKSDDAPKAEGDDATPPAKRRSGRPVTPRLLAAANNGGTVSGPAKTRLLRAVNRILEQRKKDAVDLRALF
jgi:hypothetical protein